MSKICNGFVIVRKSKIRRRCRTPSTTKVKGKWYCKNHNPKIAEEVKKARKRRLSVSVDRYKKLKQKQDAMKRRNIESLIKSRKLYPSIRELKAEKGETVFTIDQGHLKAFSGPLVYLFKLHKLVLYVGMSAMGIHRCFSEAHDAREARRMSDCIEIHACESARKAAWLERVFIKRYAPKFNKATF